MAASSPPRRSRLLALAAVAVAVVLVAAVGMYLYDHSRRDLIANGVRIDGVSVGGMREAAALTKIQDQLIARLDRPLAVRSGSQTWTLGAREARLTVDAQNMVAQAVNAGREGSIVTRTVRGLFGGSVNRNIPLVVSYSHPAVSGLTAKVRAAVNRAPRDATVQPGASGLNEIPAQDGLTVNNAALGGRIARALTGATASRTVVVPVRRVRPAVTTSQLAAKYPAYIVIDRGTFRLRFYDHLKLSKTYEIAVGMEGLETPAGLHHIEWEQVDPPWYVPKKRGRERSPAPWFPPARATR